MTNADPNKKAFAITLDGSSGPEERAFLALHYCVRVGCGHHWDGHGTTGAVLPSKSKCQLDGCACVRFVLPGEEAPASGVGPEV